MDFFRPHAVAISDVDAAVIWALAYTVGPLSGRAVARSSGVPKTTASRALKRLVEHGLVVALGRGDAAVTLYVLNEDHLAAEPVLALLDLRGALRRRIYQEIKGWKPRPEDAWLLGAAARAQGGTANAVFVLVVKPPDVDQWPRRWAGQVRALEDRVRRWTGNEAIVMDVSREELECEVEEGGPLAEELEQGAVQVFGHGTYVLPRPARARPPRLDRAPHIDR